MRRIVAITVAAALAVTGLAALLAGCSASESLSGEGLSARSRVFGSRDWDSIEAHPDAYKGATVMFMGRVFRAWDPRQSPPNIQVFADPARVTGTTVVATPSDPGAKPGQYVIVRATVVGEYMGANTAFAGTDVKPILVQAQSVTLTTPPEAAQPKD